MVAMLYNSRQFSWYNQSASTRTVQTPQRDRPQPNWVPVIPNFSRLTHNKGSSELASTWKFLNIDIKCNHNEITFCRREQVSKFRLISYWFQGKRKAKGNGKNSTPVWQNCRAAPLHYCTQTQWLNAMHLNNYKLATQVRLVNYQFRVSQNPH